MARRSHAARRRARSNPQGTLQVNASGYGFVKTAEGEFFIAQNRMNGAFDGDVVEVAPFVVRGHGDSSQKPKTPNAAEKCTAKVVQVLGRAHAVIVGRYEVAEPFGVVVPEDPRLIHDVFTLRSESPDVPDGAIVAVRITQYPTRTSACTGVIEEVLGSSEQDVLVDLIVARHKLETEFSPQALALAQQAQLDVPGALRRGYRDVRDRFTITIDPVDARDFDDAISIEEVEFAGRPAWRLGVHIADVSAYVPWESALDLDARRRATSVYLADRVIPMLPEDLSNELCSLKPGCDRLSMTVDMVIDASGALRDVDIYPAVICSNRRLTYEFVQEALDASDGPTGQDRAARADLAHWDSHDCTDTALVARLRALRHISRQLIAAGAVRGSLEFEKAEAKVRLTDSGEPEGIDIRVKTDATEIVEQAMILANVCVATHMTQAEFPCMYRVHDKPAPDSLRALVPILQEFCWASRIDCAAFEQGSPREIQAVLRESTGRLEEQLVHTLVIRAMSRAVYRAENLGHFGLAQDCYTHFTSPIRRYPDLMVHRMLKHQLGLETSSQGLKDMVKGLSWIAEHSSDMEKLADTAARQSQECKTIEYLQRFVGQSFDAVISGVNAYGLYARLDCLAEGFVDARHMGREYFAYDPKRHVLWGTDTGREYRLGQRIRVTIKTAEPRSRVLEFRLANPQ